MASTLVQHCMYVMLIFCVYWVMYMMYADICKSNITGIIQLFVIDTFSSLNVSNLMNVFLINKHIFSSFEAGN